MIGAMLVRAPAKTQRAVLELEFQMVERQGRRCGPYRHSLRLVRFRRCGKTDVEDRFPAFAASAKLRATIAKAVLGRVGRQVIGSLLFWAISLIGAIELGM